MEQRSRSWKIVLGLGLILFLIVFIILGFTVHELWFREDDLGQIINGIIRSWDDFVRIFSSDERDLIVPINYHRSKANVISGFLRPLKSIFFTMTYYFYGLDVQAYYVLHVIFHALNSVLLFYLFALWLPLGLSFLGGFLFAFYPEISWLAWIATLHNSLATFFLLLALLFFQSFLFAHKRTTLIYGAYFLSGLMFLLSLLSRENGVFFPLWLFGGVFLFLMTKGESWWQILKNTLCQTWIFFAVEVLYVLIRLWAFGIQTLERTYHNIFLRFPILTKFLQFKTKTADAGMSTFIVKTGIKAHVQAGHVPLTHAYVKKSIFTIMSAKLAGFMQSFFTWSGVLFSVSSDSLCGKFVVIALWIFFISFFAMAYRTHKRFLLFFGWGICCFIWPGILVYPATRYINCVYPLLIGLLVVGMYFFVKDRTVHFTGYVFLFGIIALSLFSGVKGAYDNSVGLRAAGASMVPIKQRYEQFFQKHTFKREANFIVLGSPFVSDIQNVFQYFLKNLKTQLALELFSTLAERGSMGCGKDYRIKGVKSEIMPIEGGFRFVSYDKEHCGWWLRFSNFPITWVEKDRAYEWTTEHYRVGEWYQCSIGKFQIHDMVDADCVTDISFVFDQQWINKNTVFVGWDTMQGCYYQLNAAHLQ